MSEPLQRTPLYDRHVALKARMVPFAGWEMPVQYAGVSKEHAAVRETAGLFDVSHMGELWFHGPDAVPTVDRLVTNDVTALGDGRALYTACCNEQGGILDDLIVYRVSSTRVLVVCNASNREKIAHHFAAHTGAAASLTDRSDDTALLALQGPSAEQVLRAAGAGDDLAGLARFAVAEGRLGAVPLLAARTGYTGEDGFELFCAYADAERLWDALMAAGASADLQPIGLGARDTLRLEAKLMLYGNDIDETTNPIEAGLGWVVKLDAGDFIGRAALAAIKAQGPTRRLVGFEMVDRGIARHGYPILDATGHPIGEVTSGAPALSLGKHIGLGYVPTALSKRGTRLNVEIRGKWVAAEVCKTPFYKRSG